MLDLYEHWRLPHHPLWDNEVHVTCPYSKGVDLFFIELKEPVGQIVCTDKGILAVEQNKVLIPPTWNKTLAWGYADLSCRLGTYESDKVCTISCSLTQSHLILLNGGG